MGSIFMGVACPRKLFPTKITAFTVAWYLFYVFDFTSLDVVTPPLSPSPHVPLAVFFDRLPPLNPSPISEHFASASLSSGVDRSRLVAIKLNICKAIACQPTVICHLANELDHMGLIPVTLQQAVKYADGKGPYEKADAMIGPVMERVLSDPRSIAPALMKALDTVGLGHVTTESDLIATAQ